MLAAPEAAVEKAPARPAPEPAAPERRRARRRKPRQPAKPGPFPAAMIGRDPYLAEAEDALAKLDAADARRAAEKPVEDAAEFRDDFASADPRRHARAAMRLRDLKDDQLLTLQRTWRTTLRQDFYPFLYERSAKGTTPGIEDALSLLRRALVRDKAMQEAFGGAYADQTLIGTYAWLMREGFTAAKGDLHTAQALAALRDQTPAVRKAIAATFRQHNGLTLMSWLIDRAPRTEALVRAIAILREGDDRGGHVDLAAVLIPPENSNRELPVRSLRGPLDQRKKLEATFNATFKGVGPTIWAKTPDTLRGHLAKLDSIVHSNAPYHEALMLLHHDLTDAEKLYLTLTRRRDTANESAVAVVQDLVRRGVGRKQLEADWNRFVLGAEISGKARFFAELPLREHVVAMFTAYKFTETRRHLLALIDQLGEEDDTRTVDPAVAVAAGDWDAQDEARFANEDRRLHAAEAVIKAVEGRVWSNDKAMIGALDEVAEVLRGRVTRLQNRLAQARERSDLRPKERYELIGHYEREIRRARDADYQRRRQLTTRLTGESEDPIRISYAQREAARLTLGDAPTPADKVWIAAHNHDWDDLVTVVTQIWAKGQINQMHKDAEKPGLDALAHQARPPFNLFELISSMSGTLYHRRIRTLSWAGLSDANRGVLRIMEEIREGQRATGSASGSDLAPINALLDHPDLKPDLRHKVLEAFAGAEAAQGQPAKAPDQTAENYFLNRMEALFEGRTGNWEHLRDLLEPPKTAAERRERARDIRAAGKRGRLSFVSEAAARAWSNLSGDFVYEAEARSEDRLEFIRSATDEQLAPLMELAGAKTREELSAYELKTFQTRHGDVQAVENTAATLIAGFVETLVEAGLSPLTGGTGLAAVFGAAVAAMASMVMQEALLGPDYKLISGENFNTVLQSALGTALTEIDVRKLVVAKIPLESLKNYEKTQQTVQNVITSVLEHGVTATSELTANVLLRDKWPTDADIAKQADQLIAKMIAKVPATQGTARYHPGNFRQYMPDAERLKQNVLFKLSIKVTQAAATEITSVLISGAPDQTFAQQVMQVLWKEARSVASTTTKAVGSTVAGAASAHGGHALVDQMRRQHPDLFPPLLHQVLNDHYESNPKLKDEHAQQQAKGRKITVDQFMLEKLRAPDPKGTVDPTKIRSKIEKELLTYSELLTGRQTGTPGVLAYREKTKGIQPIADEESAPPEPDPALAGKDINWDIRRLIVADRHYQARSAADRAAREEKEAFERLPLPAKLAEIKRRRIALAEGVLDPAPAHASAPPAPLSSLRVTALMKEHARLDPEHFGTRAKLVAQVLEGDTPFARGVLAGDPASIATFLKEHGDWGQTIQILQTLGAGPEAARLGIHDHTRILQAERNRLAVALRKRGAEASEHASTEVTSDLDLAIADNDRRRAIEQQMRHDYGDHWRTMWNLSFFGDATHLTRYADFAHLVSSERRGATQARLTNLAEHYAFTRMLWLADRSGRKDTKRFVENLAAELEIDLSHARVEMAKLGPKAAPARLRELEGEIDEARRDLNAAEHDTKSPPEKRLQLAEHLAELAMEANFLTREANISGGASRALLQGVRVEGPETYQAFLNDTLMYVEHSVEDGSHLTYVPGKYRHRMVGMIQSAGIDDPDLNAHGQVAAYAYRQDRLVNSKGARRRDGLPANINADLLAEKTRFEAAVLKPAGALKRAATARLDVIAPPAPANAPPAAAKLPEAIRRQKGMRPADRADGKREAGTAPAPPAGFTDARQFLDRLGEALHDPPGDFVATLSKRAITLDVDTAARWSAYLAERYARGLGDAAVREDLRVIHATLVRLKEQASGK